MEHQPDFEEWRALRVVARDAIVDAVVSGNYSATLGRYRVRALRRTLSGHPGWVQVEFEIAEQRDILDSGIVACTRVSSDASGDVGMSQEFMVTHPVADICSRTGSIGA